MSYPISRVLQRAWGHAAVFAVGTISLSASQIALAPLLTRRLSSAEYGTYEVLLATYIVLRSVMVLPLASGVVFVVSKHTRSSGERAGLLGSMSLVSVALSAAFVCSALAFPGWPTWFVRSDVDLRPVGSLILFGLACEAPVQLALGALRGAQEPRLYVLAAVGQFASTLVTAVWLVGVRRVGLPGVFGAFLLGSLFGLLILAVGMSNRVSRHLNWLPVGRLLVFAATIVPVNVANLILSISDRYFLNSCCSLASLGMYGLAYKIASASSMLVVLPFITAWPAIIYSEDHRNRIGELVSGAALTLLVMGLLVIVAATAAARPLVLLLGGPPFLGAVRLVPILAMGGLLYGGMGVMLSAVVARGHLRLNMYALLATAGCGLAVNALLIPPLGPLGAACATLSAYAIGYISSAVLAGRLVPLNVAVVTWLKVVVSAALAVWVGRSLQDVTHFIALNAFFAGSLGGLAYVLLLILLRVIPRRVWALALKGGVLEGLRNGLLPPNDG